MDENKNLILPVSILVAAILISYSLFATRSNVPNNQAQNNGANGNNPAPAAPSAANLQAALALTSRDVVLGDPNAKVTVIEYADYQCPFCGKFFTDDETQMIKDYVNTGKAKLVYRNFPFIDQFQGGQNESHLAAEAVYCAEDQGKFWPYHDLLFKTEIADAKENSGNLNRALFLNLAGQLSLDKTTFAQCFDSGKYVSQVQKDYNDASAIGVNSTPITFVNGTEVQGAVPYVQFKAAIDKALASS